MTSARLARGPRRLPVRRLKHVSGYGGRFLALAEIVTAVLVAGASAVAVRAFADRVHFRAQDLIAAALGPVWAAGMVALALVAYLIQRRVAGHTRTRMVVAVLAGAAAGLAMIPLSLGLHGTSQPLNTITSGDMLFRTEDVTRFGATWQLQDYTIRGLAAFYPPAWFWAAGRTAALLGVVPWRIMAPFTVATIGAALIAAFALWRAVLTPAGALCAAIGSSLVLPTAGGGHPVWFTGWYSTYSCFVAVVGPAWVAATTHTVRRGWSPGRLAVLVVAGALLALTYYLLFVVLVAVLLALAAGWAGGGRPALLRAGGVCSVVAALTAVFWVPLLGMLRHGGATAGHYVSHAAIAVSLGLDGPVALAVLAVVSVTVLASTIARPASQAVGSLLVATVLYQILSGAAVLLIHDQLLPYRAVTMLWAGLGAAVPVALDGSRHTALPRQASDLLSRVAGVVGGAAILALGGAQGADLASGPLTRQAQAVPRLAGTDAMARFIAGVTHKRPDELTILVGTMGGRQWRVGGPPAPGGGSPTRALLATQPFYGFLPLRARYGNPAAQVPQRIALLKAAAACRSAACTARALTRSRFGPIDAVVLRRVRDGYLLFTQQDGFPKPRNIPVLFRRNSFSPTTWAHRDFGADRLFVRRAASAAFVH